MKKFGKSLLILLASAMLIGFAGCKTGVEDHTHTFAESWTSDSEYHWHAATCEHTTEKSGKEAHKWNDGKVTVEPSCKDDGIKTFTCTVCKKEKTETLSKLEHDWNEGVITKDPSEESDGIKTYTCNNCGEEKTEPVEKLNHTHKFAEIWSYDETNHWHAATCGHNEKADEEAHTENSGVTTTAATCVTKGVKSYKCKVCDVVLRTEEIAATGHTEDEGTVTTAATCLTKGVKTYKCKTCNTVLRTEEIAATGHTEDEGTVTAATCVTKGVKTYKCKTCNAVLRTEEIPELYSVPVDAETGNAVTASSKYIYFGVFPKTVLPSGSSVTVDESVKVDVGINTYYKGNDGNWYAKVTAKQFYESYKYLDGTPVISGIARYFKVEPIKWKVLTENYNGTDKALLLAEDILTANVPYYKCNSYDNKRTVGLDSNIYPNNYKYSQIRAYLNGLDYYYDKSSTSTIKKTDYMGNGFLQTAFTTTAQSLIDETEVDNSADSTTDTSNNLTEATSYVCENTIDKIFLLSEYEVTTTAYGFAAYNSSGQENVRIRIPTDYAKANYAFQSTTAGYGGKWWLRSPYYSSFSGSAIFVEEDGGSSYNAFVNDALCGVVPALCISLQ